MLLPFLDDPRPIRSPIRVRDRVTTYADLATRSAALAGALDAAVAPGARVAVLAGRELETVVAIVAVLRSGRVAVPVNPDASARELAYLIADSTPAHLLAPRATLDGLRADTAVTDALARLPTDLLDLDLDPGLDPGTDAARPPRPADDAPALMMYTSGTTGPPKGAVLSHGAVAANLDMLAAVWRWTAADVLVHALPLYHVHGLVLGVLGPLRRGAGLHHLGAFDADATARALDAVTLANEPAGTAMHFGVPTIYHRLADAAEVDPDLALALARARLLVSGSAGLPLPVHEKIRRLTGHTIAERYGMTETMITTAVPAGCTDRAGTVGPALPGVSLRVVDDHGDDVPADGEHLGEIRVRTPAVFSGYLGRPDDTAACYEDGWFVTGDTATIDVDGFVRIRGRSSTDIIKSGGFKIGAGEIEDVLLDHPDVAEAAVRALPDDDLGELVAAWVVPRPGTTLDADGLAAFAATQLSRHKRPRRLFVVDALPRNGMGKVQKTRLAAPAADREPTAPGPGPA